VFVFGCASCSVHFRLVCVCVVCVVCVCCVCVLCVCELCCGVVCRSVSFVISVWRVSRSVVVLGLWLSSWYSSR
jgi:hypothetical protein